MTSFIAVLRPPKLATGQFVFDRNCQFVEGRKKKIPFGQSCRNVEASFDLGDKRKLNSCGKSSLHSLDQILVVEAKNEMCPVEIFLPKTFYVQKGRVR